MGSNKKKIFLALTIILIVIIMLAGVYISVFLKKDEQITNKSEEEQNIIESVSTEIGNNITNEIEQKDIIEEQEDKSSKEETKNKTTENKTINSKNSNAKTESKTTKNKTTNSETNKSNQSTSTKENKSSLKTSSKTEKTENTNIQTNNSSKTNTTNSTKNEKPTLTGTTDEKKLIDSYIKYGVEVKTYTYTIYNVYSDGSKEVKSQTTTTGYERTNYKATTSELLDEARTARSKYSGMISQILNNVNTYRKEANTESKNGITNRVPLTLDEQLCVAANVRAVEMAYSKKYSHTRPNGSGCLTVLNEMGINYLAAGENIANGYTSAASVSQGWKKSPGHYENMISENFSKIGIGVYKLEDSYYWVQLFTN